MARNNGDKSSKNRNIVVVVVVKVVFVSSSSSQAKLQLRYSKRIIIAMLEMDSIKACNATS